MKLSRNIHQTILMQTESKEHMEHVSRATKKLSDTTKYFSLACMNYPMNIQGSSVIYAVDYYRVMNYPTNI